MRMLKYLIPALLLSISTSSYSASDSVPLPFNDLPDFTVLKGQVMYQRYCLFCHGEKGEGDGPNGLSMAEHPADLRKIVPERENEQLFTVIQQGGAKNNLSPAMPSFEHTLSARQMRQLILYIKSFEKKK